jgi:hypothetical protein
MSVSDQVLRFFGEFVAYGGGAAVVAYLLFQYLGKSWIENKFAQRLDLFKHQQAIELQRLRVEIDSMLSGALKLQEKEFQVLPEAWQKLDEAHGLVAWLFSPMREYADVDRMNPTQLDELLARSEFTESQKDEVRNSHQRRQTYQDIIFWHRVNKVRKAFSELQSFVARRRFDHVANESGHTPKKMEAISPRSRIWVSIRRWCIGHLLCGRSLLHRCHSPIGAPSIA